MSQRALRFFALLLVGLGLAPGAAHLLEMPVKLGYTPEQYFAVTSTLYALFGAAGAVVQVAAFLLTGVLAFVSRRASGVRLVVAAAMLLGLSLVAWAALVAPVNARWGEAIQAGSPSLPQLYADLRLRWELGHVVAFVLWLVGYCCLLWFALGGPTSAVRRKDAA
jgi:hypothetical protein